MPNEIKKIPFENGELLGVRTEDGRIWLGVKKACLDIGLSENQARAERKKITSGLLYQNQWIELGVKFDPQIRKTILLAEKYVPMWLAQINLTPTMQRENPRAVERLLKYQHNAADVLHNAFMGTEETRQQFFDDMGLHGEIIEIKQDVSNLTNKVDTMESTLQTYIDSTTINSRQAQKLLFAAKDRVSDLLGGAHSKRYRDASRTYFKNLWLDLCYRYEVGSYKDLNPVHLQDAEDFIIHWSYTE